MARDGKGPLSVQLAFRYINGGFEFSTKPPLLRAKVFMRAGRANVIVHHENYGSDGTLERYVMAEDPIEFIEPDVNLEIEAFYTTRPEPEAFIAIEYS